MKADPERQSQRHVREGIGQDIRHKGRVLLIDDTLSLCMTYRSILDAAGFEVETAGDAETALKRFRADPARVVLLDLMLPDRDGLDLLREFQTLSRPTPVIVITAHGSIDRAVTAMRAGAHLFLVKPVDSDTLVESVTRAAQVLATPGARAAVRADAPMPPFLGNSPPMQEIYRLIRSVARSTATVFVTGESGTGKELCAEAVHRLSPRRDKPFIALNCGAIPGDLLESEVFGHLKGSFTGAISDKQGAAAVADGGTLFLDEICEMDLNLQTKLLRFLQTSAITPVGAARARKVDVRIVCATNRDPEEEVRAGRFREDLYYRLHVVPIHMPPLRDRGEDVIEIAHALLQKMADEEGQSMAEIAPDVQAVFRSYGWPGNVRQLINALRQAVVLNDGPVLTLGMLPQKLREAGAPVPAAPAAPAASAAPCDAAVDRFRGMTLAEIERLAIDAAIARHDGSVPRAARELDVSPSTLYRKRAQWADDTGTTPEAEPPGSG
ncbi:MAG: sigma-54-dependent Fis family transcriptional regulator [Rhodobacteraceae bacterium]|nr:sigma-54-dependent Fis family transcriptional regulator [Paracoccaceae bacterium]